MDIRILSRDGISIPIQTPSGEEAGAQTTATYRELLPKLMKTSLPLILLVILKTILQYGIVILFYVGWIMVYQNLSNDFAGSLVFGSSEGRGRSARDFLRSIFLVCIIVLVVGDTEVSGSHIYPLLYFSRPSNTTFAENISNSLYSAIVVDVLIKTFSLSFKIGFNSLAHFFQGKSFCWKVVSTADGNDN